MATHTYDRQATASDMAAEIDRRGSVIEALEAKIEALSASFTPPAEIVLETTAETRAELAKRLRKVSPQPWSTDCEKNDGVYGEGDDTTEGFDSYFIIDANSRRVADTINSDATVEVEYDEDGTHAWDEAGRQNLELIVLLMNEAGHLLRDHDTITTALAAERAARIEAEGRAEQRREALDEAVEDMRRIASNIDHGISLKLVRIDLNAAANRARAAPSPSNPGDAA